MRLNFLRPNYFRALIFLACFCSAPVAAAADPIIRNLNVRGLQIAGTTNLVIDGDNLAARRCSFLFPSNNNLGLSRPTRKQFMTCNSMVV